MKRRKIAKDSHEINMMLCFLALFLIILSLIKARTLAVIVVISVLIVSLALLDFNTKVKVRGDSVDVETYKNRKNSSDPSRKDE
ncbi:hypothetical protein EZV73_10260 [Acidaminobacter sp. JC074]|uniref:hypothetical protein n=1 Tax=Acidaminobacter sp. JC074 TaxID=2530199 RepID=UPI001F0F601A|nr:hypothetical protein [Acidaminobacter sp. JC074]MCH4887958.1 hypothetical protein [Acidaminobacter sp. JC074]